MRVVLVLAAGRSRRFVGGNKLLAHAGGRPILSRALAAARAAPAARIIVVAGHDRARIARIARGPRTSVVFAHDHPLGVSASLRAGLAALWPIEREIFVFLGDMPAIPAALPRRLARSLRPGDDAVRPRGRDGPGHPVLLRRPDRATVARLRGDRGLAGLIAGRTRWLTDNARQPADIDTRRDLARSRPRRMR
ncbi:nucleotidyltransferase family protein [Sphingomonas solaris]|uniref:Nucleotidyltransferase family protein n=1 Tax=Alterirhizorhabdus solaris TaxID=2529389 RepID=A0A558R2U8_9SPHN|nr:nucleotidyltransferase family protein [Sphingomonas solaris]TVV73696.1 nucleotidyltransferase family protein [Sphingomonas solaris]